MFSVITYREMYLLSKEKNACMFLNKGVIKLLIINKNILNNYNLKKL